MGGWRRRDRHAGDLGRFGYCTKTIFSAMQI